MEKYGVDEELPGDKLGSENPTCPDCGAPLVDKNATGILICPNCGTKPFEKKP